MTPWAVTDRGERVNVSQARFLDTVLADGGYRIWVIFEEGGPVVLLADTYETEADCHAAIDRLVGIHRRDDATETVHRYPPDGETVLPCCGRTPFEVPGTDRLAFDDTLVTCRPATTPEPRP